MLLRLMHHRTSPALDALRTSYDHILPADKVSQAQSCDFLIDASTFRRREMVRDGRHRILGRKGSALRELSRYVVQVKSARISTTRTKPRQKKVVLWKQFQRKQSLQRSAISNVFPLTRVYWCIIVFNRGSLGRRVQ